MTQEKAIKKKENTSMALAGMFEEDSNTGLDNMGADDMALPFLRVLGQLSPEINKRDAKYVEGAEAGMIFNTVTKVAYDGEKGLNIIPCYYKREYVEWSDRGQGTSAPVAIHSVNSGIIKKPLEVVIGKTDYQMVIILRTLHRTMCLLRICRQH